MFPNLKKAFEKFIRTVIKKQLFMFCSFLKAFLYDTTCKHTKHLDIKRLRLTEFKSLYRKA